MPAFKIAEPTGFLRFVIRDGKRILQQKWKTTEYADHGKPIGISHDWRDVPLEEENEY